MTHCAIDALAPAVCQPNVGCTHIHALPGVVGPHPEPTGQGDIVRFCLHHLGLFVDKQQVGVGARKTNIRRTESYVDLATGHVHDLRQFCT